MSDAIEVLKKYSTSCSVCKYDGGNQCKASGGEFRECKPAEELSKAINDALLALKKQKNGLKCIGCGSIPKLKLCCNSCYQELKLKEKRQVELIEWLEKEIRKCYPKNFCLKDWTPIMDTVQKQVRHDTLKEVLERLVSKNEI